MPRRRFTQADVAAMAGVSQSTVSFVLNGSAPAGVRISEETRSRVIEAMRITGYSANPMAQRLAGGRNQILGVFTYEKTFPRGGQDFYGGFLNGIEQAAEQLGVDMLLFTSARVVDGRRRLTRDGWQRLGIADGCLLLGQQEDQSELQHLLDTNYPFVFIGKRTSEGRMLPFVGADYVEATARQVSRLTERGHTRIGYAGPRGTDQPTLDRIEGYTRAMRDAGFPLRFVDVDDVADAADEIVERGLTAILVAPEHHPEELADELAVRGRHVPQHVSMLLLGQPLHPRKGGRSWSGFVVPREEMGARAVVLLSRIVEQESRAEGASRREPVLDDADYHQLLPCPDVDGATIAAAVSSSSERNPA
ncbi:LacI family DNA-binding transcriptional regulator [Microbacterium sp. ISL-59]|uniref:LacI family DNA-binding transcriptional regulator n=1 Tax=Microbacterium sp. ISL-59 TaxID=2819159 RepID=UPI001BEBDEBB|nr:LacI family DNA-binding transcriptional regulator [Microbacterium sp. ISL-59]MBT2496836.1 LacI family DNA-binding transcriptional regulator [Microbacterium sp. ISL-59]